MPKLGQELAPALEAIKEEEAGLGAVQPLKPFKKTPVGWFTAVPKKYPP